MLIIKKLTKKQKLSILVIMTLMVIHKKKHKKIETKSEPVKVAVTSFPPINLQSNELYLLDVSTFTDEKILWMLLAFISEYPVTKDNWKSQFSNEILVKISDELARITRDDNGKEED